MNNSLVSIAESKVHSMGEKSFSLPHLHHKSRAGNLGNNYTTDGIS